MVAENKVKRRAGIKKNILILRIIKPWSMRNLILRLNGVYPIDDVITELLENRLREKLFKEGEFLAREGQICRYLYYIEKGIVSHYSTRLAGNVTHRILWENDIVTSVESFFQQIPSRENIVTHENTLVKYITYQDWAETFQKSDSWKFITDRVKTEYYSKLGEHDRLKSTLSHEELIKHILGKNPELLKRVGRDTFASWLGMTTKTLNKYI
jgi:hypothetical protein